MSPYYDKGGCFHGIHYGSYFDDANVPLSIMRKEEDFILNSPEKRRVMIDFYETRLSETLVKAFTEHISKISPKIVKLAIASEKACVNYKRPLQAERRWRKAKSIFPLI
ncbi:MAG: hypothetical protein Q4G07_09680 [Oscillospiraceae bacterium]|nr:hypothetical protein [Oscillospiraceae bacterium]